MEGDAAVGQRESGPIMTTASGERRIPDSNPPPQAIPTTSSAAPPASSSSKAPSNKKFATLGDLGGGGTGHAGHGHDHDDDSDDNDENQDFFAGGEKSGLAVQNPDDLKRKILEKAKKLDTYLRHEVLQADFLPQGILVDQAVTIPVRLPPALRAQLVLLEVMILPARLSKILTQMYHNALHLSSVCYTFGPMASL